MLESNESVAIFKSFWRKLFISYIGQTQHIFLSLEYDFSILKITKSVFPEFNSNVNIFIINKITWSTFIEWSL